MFALADCNNFFVSCERVFRPDLRGRPVIVLSSNDGCAVARSNEAKALGIKMGAPYFQIRHLVKQHNVAVFSGNMALYGDMSQRVRWVLEEFAPSIEYTPSTRHSLTCAACRVLILTNTPRIFRSVAGDRPLYLYR